jgi:outer membrane protein OmpA-like peptidoglycan-associated protein
MRQAVCRSLNNDDPKKGGFMRRIFCIGLLIGLAGCAGLPIFGHSRYVVFFKTGSATLDQPAQAVVAAAARTANAYPLTAVTVVGAADTDGTSPANVRLSEARASAVAAALVADGVTAARVHAEGLGEVGSLPASEQASRRAIIHFGLR